MIIGNITEGPLVLQNQLSPIEKVYHDIFSSLGDLNQTRKPSYSRLRINHPVDIEFQKKNYSLMPRIKVVLTYNAPEALRNFFSERTVVASIILNPLHNFEPDSLVLHYGPDHWGGSKYAPVAYSWQTVPQTFRDKFSLERIVELREQAFNQTADPLQARLLDEVHDRQVYLDTAGVKFLSQE